MSQQADLEASTPYVLDASALLVLLHGEPGQEIVESAVSVSSISSVNWAEVLQKIIVQSSRNPRDVGNDLEYLGLNIVPFTAEDAETVAELWAMDQRNGLSLGDGACLSLAKRLGLPALTADRSWATLNLGINVRLIR